MTEAEYARKLAEIERLLNDPDVPMQPSRVWTLLAEIAERGLRRDEEAADLDALRVSARHCKRN